MGKSEVANVFESAGVPVFDADKAVHALYGSVEGGNLLRALAPSAVRQTGSVDREELTKLVMADGKLLERLEQLVHAVLAERRQAFLAQARRDGHAVAVMDVPLLFEKGLDKEVDFSIVVSAPQNKQRLRAMRRPGMSAEKLNIILARQMPDAEKRRRADFVLENDGTLEELREKTLALLQDIRKRSRQ
jgi:dephospho-CoA kinase